MKPYKLLSVLFIFLHQFVNGEVIELTQDNWTIDAEQAEFTSYLGKDALRLHNGSAKLEDTPFINGIIEYNVAFDESRAFTGINFRQLDKFNTEKFYIRPHQSGHPDANQYTPVYNGITAWQLYHGSGYSNAIKYKFNEWNHIKIVVSGNRGEVFINDMTRPALTINHFDRSPAAGDIAFYASLSQAYYANIKITKLSAPELMSQVDTTSVETSADTYVPEWQISDRFHSDTLNGVGQLQPAHKNEYRWHNLKVDHKKIANLAKIQGVDKTANTAFAKFSLNSEKTQLKELNFGYSDKVRVFVNDKLVYSGDNSFQSRDYRYLGTIGLFDTVYLPLKEGYNEIFFAVSERFGGWGITASFAETDNITF